MPLVFGVNSLCEPTRLDGNFVIFYYTRACIYTAILNALNICK